MRRILAIVVIASTLLFGAYHASAGGGFSHAMHGETGSAAGCMMTGCPVDGGAAAIDCVTHCLASAGAVRDVVPPLMAVLLALTAVLAAAFAARAIVAILAASSEELAAVFLRHRSLDTIVLRN